MDELVERLSQGEHPVELSFRQEPSIEALKERLSLRFIHVKFTGTRGGTELGLDLENGAVDLSNANLEDGTGRMHIEADLTLNYEKVRCIADIDLTSLKGTGRLISQAA